MNDPVNAPQDPVGRLIHAAGRREAPPEGAYESVLAATSQAWQAKVRRRRWRMAASIAASVAVLVAAAGVVFEWKDRPAQSVAPIADIVRVVGSVRVRSSGSDEWISLREDAGQLSSGAALRTDAAGAAALRLQQIALRIADHSEVVIESVSRVRLIRGKIYVDTGSQGASNRILVVTDAASVSDVGTQFEVHYAEGNYRVRVREGEIQLQRGNQRRRGVRGEQISIDGEGRVRIAGIAPHDPAWDWTQALASAPDIDDEPLTVLLAWVARETGAPVRYATPDIERKAAATILHGSIKHLAPLEALAVMLATTDLKHEVLNDGTIMIK